MAAVQVVYLGVDVGYHPTAAASWFEYLDEGEDEDGCTGGVTLLPSDVEFTWMQVIPVLQPVVHLNVCGPTAATYLLTWVLLVPASVC